MSASSPQLDSEKLSRHIWFELEDGELVISCMFCYTDDIVYRGPHNDMGETDWLSRLAQHVLDKHP